MLGAIVRWSIDRPRRDLHFCAPQRDRHPFGDAAAHDDGLGCDPETPQRPRRDRSPTVGAGYVERAGENVLVRGAKKTAFTDAAVSVARPVAFSVTIIMLVYLPLLASA